MTVFAEAVSALTRDLVLSAIGLGSDGGWMRRCDVIVGGAVDVVGSACTLGSATVGVACGCNDDANVDVVFGWTDVSTLGDGAGVVDDGTLGDGTSGGCCSVEKMARRLSMAKSWSSVLVGVRSA